MHRKTAFISSSVNFAARDFSISPKSSTNHWLLLFDDAEITMALLADEVVCVLRKSFDQYVEVEGATKATANSATDGFARYVVTCTNIPSGKSLI